MSEERKTPLTQQAYDRLREELDYLEGEGRTKIIEQISVARQHGDLSENAEYHAAKDQQGLQEVRARQIKQMLESAEIIHAEDDGVVEAGKLVTIRHEGDDEPETYLLGTREEKGGKYDVLTPDSPIGQAIVGRAAGDVVRARVPSGDIKVEIVEVRAL